MIERCGGSRFPLDQRETIDRGRALTRNLESHSPVETQIVGDIHVAHAAAPKLRLDGVVT
jgi:hypothetical protein